MLYFYRKHKPIPINFFYSYWLINSPFVLQKPWQIWLNNIDYIKGDTFVKEQDIKDRSAKAGKQLIINITLAIVKKHKTLPFNKEIFVIVFKKISDFLAKNQD
jgi:hypothetical protein